MSRVLGMHPRCFLCLEALDDDTIAEGSDLCDRCLKGELEYALQEDEQWPVASTK
jgi:hypothetical protein